MAFAYPVSLEVGGRRAVVIGTVAVALGKAEGLLEAGADVTILATEPAGHLDRLAAQGVTVVRRGFASGDLSDAFVCVASDPDAATRDAIFAEATERGVLINMVDDVPRSTWAAPAVVRRGDLILAISTGGRSPSLARRLREEFEEIFGPEWAVALNILEELRDETRPMLPTFEERAARWSEALDTDELIVYIRDGNPAEAKARLKSRLLPAGSA
jgi:precorrin-2 dehydrogenase/sirohydrochlorin ferrochelatase